MDGKIIGLWILTLSFWGSAPLFEKIALRATDPLLALTLRSGMAVLILVLATLFTGKISQVQELTLRDFGALGASGLLAGVLGMFTYFSLLKTGQASKVVPLTAAYPLVTAILSLLFLGEKLTLMRLFGILLTISGLIILQRS
jgi:transporter family protein